jgi:hypothetical protein
MVKVVMYFLCKEILCNRGSTGEELIDFYSKIFLPFLFLFEDGVHFDIEYNNKEEGLEYYEKLSKSTSLLFAEIGVVLILALDEADI